MIYYHGCHCHPFQIRTGQTPPPVSFHSFGSPFSVFPSISQGGFFCISFHFVFLSFISFSTAFPKWPLLDRRIPLCYISLQFTQPERRLFMPSFLGNLIVILLLALLLFLALRSIRRSHKAGKHYGCGGSCSGNCSQCCGLAGKDRHSPQNSRRNS